METFKDIKRVAKEITFNKIKLQKQNVGVWEQSSNCQKKKYSHYI